MSVSLAQSLDGSTMETSKEQTQRLGLQFSSTDQIPTTSHEKKESFDWDYVATTSVGRIVYTVCFIKYMCLTLVITESFSHFSLPGPAKEWNRL